MELSEDAQNMILEFQVAGSEQTVNCEITIEFVGLKGHLLGFHFQL